MNVFVLLNTKEDILKNVRNRAVLGHHWLPYFFSYYGSQWCPKTDWLQTFFRISSFVFGRTKKFIQVWNYLRVSKLWQNFHFWVNYPFNERCINIVSKFCEHSLLAGLKTHINMLNSSVLFQAKSLHIIIMTSELLSRNFPGGPEGRINTALSERLTSSAAVHVWRPSAGWQSLLCLSSPWPAQKHTSFS